MTTTSVTIVGAGATGAYLGALLSTAPDVRVRLVARGRTLAAIREHGVVVRLGDEVLRARPAAIAPEEVTPEGGFVLLCVKTYDNTEALETVHRAMGADGTFVNLQNGVRHDRELAGLLGAGRILVSALYVAAERSGPAEVVARNRPSLVVGPLSGADLSRAQELRSLLVPAGIGCEVDAAVAERRWEKWALNCALNAMTAVSGRRSDEIWAQPAARRMFETVVDEALATAIAAGAPVAAGARDRVLTAAASLRCDSSMAEDLRAGRPLEREEFTGELLRLASDASRVPMSAALDALLELVDPASIRRGGRVDGGGLHLSTTRSAGGNDGGE